MESKRISNRTSSISSGVGRVRPAIPVGIPPVLRRFWDFTKKMAHEFAKQLKDPNKKEENMIREVTRRF